MSTIDERWNIVDTTRAFCQKVLPLVYDESLSYMELVCKVSSKLNEVIENNNNLPQYVKDLIKETVNSDDFRQIVGSVLMDTIINVKFPPEGITPAKGDGVTDDTSSIQACFDYANSQGGAVVFFPSGKYLTGTLSINTETSILGADRYNTSLVLKGGGNTPLLQGAINQSVRNIALDGNRLNQVEENYLIDGDIDMALFDNVILCDSAHCITADTCNSSEFCNVMCKDIGDGVFITAAGNNNLLTNINTEYDINLTGDNNNWQSKRQTKIGSAEPLRYKRPQKLNDLFSYVPMQDTDGNDYNVLVEGNNLQDLENNDAFVLTDSMKQAYKNDTLNCIASYLVRAINDDGSYNSSLTGAPQNATEKFVFTYSDGTKGYAGLLGQDEFVYSDTIDVAGFGNLNVAYIDCSQFLTLITKCRGYLDSPFYYAFTNADNYIEYEAYKLAKENGGIEDKPYTFDYKNYIYTARMGYLADTSGNALNLFSVKNDNSTATFFEDVLNDFETGDIIFVSNPSRYPTRYKSLHHVGYYLKSLEELNNVLSQYNVMAKTYNDIDDNRYGYFVHVTYSDNNKSRNILRIESLYEYCNTLPSQGNRLIYLSKGRTNALMSNKAFQANTGLFIDYQYPYFSDRIGSFPFMKFLKDGLMTAKQFVPYGDILDNEQDFDLLKDGLYFSDQASAAIKNYKNAPKMEQNEHWTVFVTAEYFGSKYQGTQIILGTNHHAYYRTKRYNTSSWSPWTQFSGSTTLEGGEDLNTLEPGNYFIKPSVDISSITNLPNNIPVNSTIYIKVFPGVGYRTIGYGKNMVQLLFAQDGFMAFRITNKDQTYYGNWFKITTTQA